MDKAVCYARVSSRDESGLYPSIEVQVAATSAYCASMNLEVVKVFKDEGVTGAKPLDARPEGSLMLGFLEKRNAEHVIALKLDRLFRNAEHALEQTRKWDSRGIALHLCDLGGTQLNTKSPIGKVVLTLMAAFAEFERSLIAERTSTALRHKKRNREAYNHPPYGFRREGKIFVPVEAEQRILKRIFQFRREGLSLYDIACRLNDFGVPSKLGGQWHSATIAHIVNNDLHHDMGLPETVEQALEAAESLDTMDGVN